MTQGADALSDEPGRMEEELVLLQGGRVCRCRRSSVERIQGRGPIPRDLYVRPRGIRGQAHRGRGGGPMRQASRIWRPLTEGRLAAAGLDVFAPEPPRPGNPLFAAPNLVLSPHIGGAAREAMDRTALAVAEAVLAALAQSGSGAASPPAG